MGPDTIQPLTPPRGWNLECPLLGVKRTGTDLSVSSANDPIANAENGSEVPVSELETTLLLSALRPVTTMIVLHWRFHLRGSSPGSRYSRPNGPMAVTWVTYSPDFAQ